MTIRGSLREGGRVDDGIWKRIVESRNGDLRRIFAVFTAVGNCSRLSG